MIAELKPYPAMKDSGVPWLGEVPEHWNVEPIGQIGHIFKGNGGNKEDEVSDGVPCVRYGDLYTKHEFFIRNTKAFITAERAADYTPIRYGDVLFAASGETIEDIGRSAVNLIETAACCGGDVLLFRPRVEAVANFLGYAADSPSSRHQKACMGRGFTVVHIYGSHLKRLVLPLPPLPEQAAIVRFLDHVDRRIRRYIRAKQKLIKLLEEQKQAIIHRAVTRGLDSNVRLKPSGVAWLGDVPEHWEVRPLKRWVSTKITDGPHETPQWLDEGISFLSAEAMVSGRLEFNRRRGFISRELHETYCRKCRPQRDDIFMCKSGATTGKVAIVETDEEFSVWSPLALIRVDSDRVLPRLLCAVLQTRYVQRQVQDTWSYGTQPNLSMAAMERLVVVMPPRQEQDELLFYLDATTKAPSVAIDRARDEMSLLREYRTRLIADVVTGKLDVREAAARLPEEADEPEPIEEAVEDADDEEDAEYPLGDEELLEVVEGSEP